MTRGVAFDENNVLHHPNVATRLVGSPGEGEEQPPPREEPDEADAFDPLTQASVVVQLFAQSITVAVRAYEREREQRRRARARLVDRCATRGCDVGRRICK